LKVTTPESDNNTSNIKPRIDYFSFYSLQVKIQKEETEGKAVKEKLKKNMHLSFSSIFSFFLFFYCKSSAPKEKEQWLDLPWQGLAALPG